MDVYIEFDGRQLTFRTNVAEVREYILETFRYMLASGVTANAGVLQFVKTATGYSIRSATASEFGEVTLASILPLIKDEIRLQFMRDRPDLLWMHAGAVERDGGALLISGTSGTGKSTLTTYLCERGWRFLTDDIAPVRMETDHVVPFPQMPVRRVHPGREVLPDDLATLQRESVTLGVESVSRKDAAIRGIVFVEYRRDGDAELVRLDQGSAAMQFLRNATNFWDHKAAAVERAARLATRVPMYRVVYGMPRSASGVLNELW